MVTGGLPHRRGMTGRLPAPPPKAAAPLGPLPRQPSASGVPPRTAAPGRCRLLPQETGAEGAVWQRWALHRRPLQLPFLLPPLRHGPLRRSFQNGAQGVLHRVHPGPATRSSKVQAQKMPTLDSLFEQLHSKSLRQTTLRAVSAEIQSRSLRPMTLRMLAEKTPSRTLRPTMLHALGGTQRLRISRLTTLHALGGRQRLRNLKPTLLHVFTGNQRLRNLRQTIIHPLIGITPLGSSRQAKFGIPPKLAQLTRVKLMMLLACSSEALSRSLRPRLLPVHCEQTPSRSLSGAMLQTSSDPLLRRSLPRTTLQALSCRPHLGGLSPTLLLLGSAPWVGGGLRESPAARRVKASNPRCPRQLGTDPRRPRSRTSGRSCQAPPREPRLSKTCNRKKLPAALGCGGTQRWTRGSVSERMLLAREELLGGRGRTTRSHLPRGTQVTTSTMMVHCLPWPPVWIPARLTTPAWKALDHARPITSGQRTGTMPMPGCQAKPPHVH
mmetsp:Transcript_2658/g.8576  ORF Transcript_2658/g.8576 Transcript_2658/m.8576 type:complete len:495 (-) Transcript_2658:969-2453(-)